MKTRIVNISTLLMVFATGILQATPITITHVENRSVSYDPAVISGASGLIYAYDYEQSYTNRALDTSIGDSFSFISINFVDTGVGAVFNYDFSLERSGIPGAQSVIETELQFKANESVTYDIAGMISLLGSGGIYGSAYLVDLTTNTTLFAEYNESTLTPNQMFVLDSIGNGDLDNYNEGFLSGSLISGHQYILATYASIYKQAGNIDAGAAAMGCFGLSIGGGSSSSDCGNISSSVPEPPPIILISIGLKGLLCIARLREAHLNERARNSAKIGIGNIVSSMSGG